MIPFLKVAVIVMGILIVGGLAVIGVKIFQKANDAAESLGVEAPEVPETAAKTAPTPFSTSIETLGLGPGARLQGMIAEGERLVLRLRNDLGDERLVIVDMNSGAVLGEIALPPPPRR